LGFLLLFQGIISWVGWGGVGWFYFFSFLPSFEGGMGKMIWWVGEFSLNDLQN
jgi:hypothetical protein